MSRDEALDADEAPEDSAAADSAADGSASAGELSEAQLEALLFVAVKPLSRREIAMLAGVERETVDERLGDLEVSLGRRGIRLFRTDVGHDVDLVRSRRA